jgi:hypothetical protein
MKDSLRSVRPKIYDDDRNLETIFDDTQLEQIRNTLERKTRSLCVKIGHPQLPNKTGENGMPEITTLVAFAMSMGYTRFCVVDDPRFETFSNGDWPKIDVDINSFITCSKTPEDNRFRFDREIMHTCLSYNRWYWKKTLISDNSIAFVSSCALKDASDLETITTFLNTPEQSKCVMIFRNFLEASIWLQASSTLSETNRASGRTILINFDVTEKVLQPEAGKYYRKAIDGFLGNVKKNRIPLFVVRCPWIITPCAFSLPKGWQLRCEEEITVRHRGSPPQHQVSDMVKFDLVIQRCAWCLAHKSDNSRLMKCGRCFGVLYCGTSCQKKHWAWHKKSCRKDT